MARRFSGRHPANFRTAEIRNALTFLLRADFTTDDAAPVESPHTAEPGPGTLTITDAEDKWSISSGKLNTAPYATPVFGAPSAISANAVTRAAGVALVATFAQ